MRVLVTGGAGFIGSHFAKRLQAAGDDVRVLDKLTYSGNPANLEGTGIELVVGGHLRRRGGRRGRGRLSTRSSTSPPRRTSTARSSARPSSSRRTSPACRCCSTRRARTGIRLVHVSTDEVYGDVADRRVLGRGRPAPPVEPVLRRQGRRRPAGARVRSRTYGVDALITRGSNTYGPFQYPEKLLPLFLTNALDGEPLPMYGDGNQVRDWLYVEDHCAGIEARAAPGPGGRGLQHRRRRRGDESRDHAARPRAHGRRRVARPPGRGPSRSRPPLLPRHDEGSHGARLGACDRARPGLPAHCRVVQRRTATGGSRSRARAATASTTSGSTRLASPAPSARSSARRPFAAC